MRILKTAYVFLCIKSKAAATNSLFHCLAYFQEKQSKEPTRHLLPSYILFRTRHISYWSYVSGNCSLLVPNSMTKKGN